MEEAQEKLLDITSEEIYENENSNIESSGSTNSYNPKFKWCYQVATYTFLSLIGEVVKSLLVTTYYAKGGKSIWLASFVQNAGFPILLPFLYYASLKNSHNIEFIIVEGKDQEPHMCIIFLVYVVLGALLAVASVFNSTGLQCLQVSTYSLTNTTRLGFTAIFSFFINAQKITPSILNSLVLLTLASVVLLLHNHEYEETSSGNFFIGFVSTIGGSMMYSLVLSLTQLSFRKILKGRNFIDIIEMSIYQTLVASIVLLLGVFASGDWKTLIMEMEEYKLGKLSYITILFVIAMSCQLYVVASIGLVFKITSLFSNVLNSLGAPITPVFAVMILHDKITSLKLLSLFLALWGFVSFIYQQYLNDVEANEEQEIDISEVSSS